jgi:hypothetical protein
MFLPTKIITSCSLTATISFRRRPLSLSEQKSNSVQSGIKPGNLALVQIYWLIIPGFIPSFKEIKPWKTENNLHYI